ncbi:Phosphoserine phosphatase, partial [Galdieria sulphuraria]
MKDHITIDSTAKNTEEQLQEQTQYERVLVSVTGKDRPGVLYALLKTANDFQVDVLDVQQSTVHRRVTIAVELGIHRNCPKQLSIYRQLLIVAKEMKLRLDFQLTNLPEGHYSSSFIDVASSNASRRRQYAITVLSREVITPKFLANLGTLLIEQGLSMEKIQRLSEKTLQCLEITVSSHGTFDATFLHVFRKKLFSLGKEYQIDIAIQPENIMRRSKRLVVMDMDSTLIQQEVIDELARYANVFEKVKEITYRAMNGEMDFKESLRQRVSCLKGTPISVFQKVISSLNYTEGARTLCSTLKRLGYKLAVISGGFDFVTQYVRRELSLDYDFANQLEIDSNGCLTGRTVGPIVDAQRKADLLQTLAQMEHITCDQVIAVGDGANDLPMLSKAGLGIAFNAKPAVQEAANFRINIRKLDAILYFLGIPEKEHLSLSHNTT